MTTDRSTFFAQFTPDQLRAGYARNAITLQLLADRAVRTGRKVNGFTADYLTERAATYRALSTADDATIRAHVAQPVPPYAVRAAQRAATLAIGRGARRTS